MILGRLGSEAGMKNNGDRMKENERLEKLYRKEEWTDDEWKFFLRMQGDPDRPLPGRVVGKRSNPYN